MLRLSNKVPYRHSKHYPRIICRDVLYPTSQHQPQLISSNLRLHLLGLVSMPSTAATDTSYFGAQDFNLTSSL
ncbi:Uncharacterized protein HZ326_24218 [Fusarium oxysporum f. sp. albedinis]|nr:Uncharacterized protein HZ326_24218 [Fusarium oxysporum f. sp. albedinis]